MQTWLGSSTHITMPIFSKLVYPNQTYCDFSNFQNVCCRRYLGFLKLQNFIGYLWKGSRRISMPNFVKIRRSIVEIENVQIFKMAAAAILDF